MWVMNICIYVTSHLLSIPCPHLPLFRLDPLTPLRCASGQPLNPGRTWAVAKPGSPPLRCPREGRCGAGGAGRPRVLAGSCSRREASRRCGIEARCAGRRPPSGLSVTDVDEVFRQSGNLRAGKRPHTQLRGRVLFNLTFTPPPHFLGGVRPERLSERLRTPLRIPAPAEHLFREGPHRPDRKCDHVHPRNARVDLHQALERCSIDPSPPRERNCRNRPPQSSGGASGPTWRN